MCLDEYNLQRIVSSSSQTPFYNFSYQMSLPFLASHESEAMLGSLKLFAVLEAKVFLPIVPSIRHEKLMSFKSCKGNQSRKSNSSMAIM